MILSASTSGTSLIVVPINYTWTVLTRMHVWPSIRLHVIVIIVSDLGPVAHTIISLNLLWVNTALKVDRNHSFHCSQYDHSKVLAKTFTTKHLTAWLHALLEMQDNTIDGVRSFWLRCRYWKTSSSVQGESLSYSSAYRKEHCPEIFHPLYFVTAVCFGPSNYNGLKHAWLSLPWSGKLYVSTSHGLCIYISWFQQTWQLDFDTVGLVLIMYPRNLFLHFNQEFLTYHNYDQF